MLSSHSKMHVFSPTNDRVFVLLAAGNLATTQAIVNHLTQDFDEPDRQSLNTCEKMIEAIQYVAQICRNEVARAVTTTADSGIDATVTLIFGGQIRGTTPAIYQLYAAGNFISESDQTPYLQIGESKYGKPILDRVIKRETSLEDAARCAIVSMDSTIRSNATVGPPIEVLVYEKDSFRTDHYIKLEEDDSYLYEIKHGWNEALHKAFSGLPRFHWEKRSSANLHTVTDNKFGSE